MRILVCGGRDYNDFAAVVSALGVHKPSTSVLIHGDAPGADRLAARVATMFGWAGIEAYPADWRTHGKAAGPIRNQQMIDEGHPDLIIAFPGGRGTADMTRRGDAAGIPVRRIAP